MAWGSRECLDFQMVFIEATTHDTGMSVSVYRVKCCTEVQLRKVDREIRHNKRPLVTGKKRRPHLLLQGAVALC